MTAANGRASSPIKYQINPGVTPYLECPCALLSRHPHLESLLAGTLVFQFAGNKTSELKALLLLRTRHGSYPLRWEYPGGTLDFTLDRSLVDTAVRELFEETNLRASRIICPVPLQPFLSGYTDQRLDDKYNSAMDSEGLLCLYRRSGRTWGIATFLVECTERNVTLNSEEHEEFIWATENEVTSARFLNGARIVFVSQEMRRIVLEGFRLAKELIRAS